MHMYMLAETKHICVCYIRHMEYLYTVGLESSSMHGAMFVSDRCFKLQLFKHCT